MGNKFTIESNQRLRLDDVRRQAITHRYYHLNACHVYALILH